MDGWRDGYRALDNKVELVNNVNALGNVIDKQHTFKACLYLKLFILSPYLGKDA